MVTFHCDVGEVHHIRRAIDDIPENFWVTLLGDNAERFALDEKTVLPVYQHVATTTGEYQ
jgi:hypothetical protein